jgi:ankyrin repeat protein
MTKKLFLIFAGGILAIPFMIIIGYVCMVLFGTGVSKERLLVNAAANDNLIQFKKIAAEGVDLNTKEGLLGQTPLTATTFALGTNVFGYLLSTGVNVDGRNNDGQTPLITAIMASGDANLFKIKALITAGANVNARDKWGNSVLHYTEMGSSHTYAQTILILKEKGAKE